MRDGDLVGPGVIVLGRSVVVWKEGPDVGVVEGLDVGVKDGELEGVSLLSGAVEGSLDGCRVVGQEEGIDDENTLGVDVGCTLGNLDGFNEDDARLWLGAVEGGTEGLGEGNSFSPCAAIPAVGCVEGA